MKGFFDNSYAQIQLIISGNALGWLYRYEIKTLSSTSVSWAEHVVKVPFVRTHPQKPKEYCDVRRGRKISSSVDILEFWWIYLCHIVISIDLLGIIYIVQ